MKRTGIIGAGLISRQYYEGLKNSKKLNLVAVCDANENYVAKDLYAEYNFYTDHLEMLKTERLDYVIISTPPASHYQLAIDVLNAGVNVIIEKPVVLQMERLKKLIDSAKSKNLDFQTMYHWQNGQEVEEFLKEYDKTKVSKISVKVLDPYSADGKIINADKVKLEGAWIDSGVNALSYAKCFLDFNSVDVIEVTVKRCEKTTLPIYVTAKLVIDGVDVDITVDWTKNKNDKRSSLIYDGRRIDILHSDQTIYDGEKTIRCDDMPRLTRHYYNFFVKNIKDRGETADTLKIHQALFAVRDGYETLI